MLYNQESNNPISELISDEVFNLLSSKGLLHEKSIRDYQIRKEYRELRNHHINATNAIDIIREKYPYLQFDTVRKIVYNIK
jgi:hypothetical protein